MLVLPFTQIPDVQSAAVSAGEQMVRLQAGLDLIRYAPLACDQGVMAQMPPEIIGQLLRTAVDFPTPQDVELIMVQQKDPARASAIRRT